MFHRVAHAGLELVSCGLTSVLGLYHHTQLTLHLKTKTIHDRVHELFYYISVGLMIYSYVVPLGKLRQGGIISFKLLGCGGVCL